MTNKHTPLPWFAQGGTVYHKDPNQPENQVRENVVAYSIESMGLGMIFRKAADAQFIARACNSHYELIEALEARAEYHAQFGYRSEREEFLHAVERAALKKAKGE